MLKNDKYPEDLVPNKRLAEKIMPYLADAHDTWAELQDDIQF